MEARPPLKYNSLNYFRPGELFAIIRYHEPVKEHRIYHSHDFVELCYVAGGNGYHILDGKEYRVTRGDLFIINYDVSHAFYRESVSDDLIIYNILFKPGFVDESLIDFNDFNSLSLSYLFNGVLDKPIHPTLKLTFEDIREFEALIHKIYTEYSERRSGYISIIRAYMIEFIILMMRCFDRCPDNREMSKRLDAIYAAMDFLKENYTQSFHLGNLASKSFFSKNYFCKLFKDTAGMTVTEFVQKLRIEEACKMMENPNKKMTDISMAIGFADYKSFYTAFTKLVGMPPSEYRKRLEESAQAGR
ncbi:helix-turn-helix domain-containing protein [Paenibacillus hemerocallicola]|uniref:Helix-turn-helix domain-containing protein n=1 Tax=Paenibacillus hemerocallicola TaxID=1172614 RepID=A0A5C4TDA6_9BACL|nr:AraC family transcriptional regulator [Paenibacillus hemerocallicola]TNJ66520.1 helix-turn-helix domain-containing protein [Paenibacillus hemerocallicola]